MELKEAFIKDLNKIVEKYHRKGLPVAVFYGIEIGNKGVSNVLIANLTVSALYRIYLKLGYQLNEMIEKWSTSPNKE